MSNTLYAIAISDTGGLHLIARIARRPTGIYYLIPRENDAFQIEADAHWDPHASYHTDGSHHIKSFDRRVFPPSKRQPLNARFAGSEPLFAQSFQPGELTRIPILSRAAAFCAVFEIPANRLTAAEHYALAVDLVAPGAPRLPGPWLEAVLEHSFRDAFPWIHVTLWRGLATFAPQ